MRKEENPARVRIVDEKGSTPYQGSMIIYWHGSWSNTTFYPLDPPPEPGMILTIEFISGAYTVTEDVPILVPAIRTSFQGTEINQHLPPNAVGSFTYNGNLWKA